MSEEKGTCRFSRAPDCLASHACVPVSNPPETCVGFSEKCHCFSYATRRSCYRRPRRVKVENSVSTVISHSLKIFLIYFVSYFNMKNNRREKLL